MDSFLYIGYRVDCKTEGKISGWTVMSQIPECKDIPPDGKSKWMYWPNDAAGSCDSYLCSTHPNKYWCPFGHQVMWNHLNSETIDLPENHEQIIQEIKKSEGFKKIQEIYGEDKVKIKYGIFKGLG